MALHGNGAASARVSAPPPPLPPLPQVHQQRLRQQQQQPLLPRPQAPSSPTQGGVSLAQPRPDGERVANDYVEAPLRHAEPAAPPRPPSRAASGPGGHRPQPVRLPLPTAKRGPSPPHVVTKQPGKKDAAGGCVGASGAAGQGPSGAEQRSGICPECGKCKCVACRNPRALPERWLCNNNVYCSPTAVVDYVSCLCCAKAIFYHCSKDYDFDDDREQCADSPCACAAPRSCARWGCLAALSVALPCLLCYWPLRALVSGYEAAHNRLTSNRGCRCRPPPHPHPQHPPHAASNKALLDASAAADKRLLDSSPE